MAAWLPPRPRKEATMKTSVSQRSVSALPRGRRTLAKAVAALLAACALAAHGPSAGAGTFTWTKFGSGNYNDPNNYFPFGTPGANDFVSFEVGTGNPYTVTFPGNDLV